MRIGHFGMPSYARSSPIRHRTTYVLSIAALAAGTVVAASVSASAAPRHAAAPHAAAAHAASAAQGAGNGVLPSPPRPPSGAPVEPAGYHAPSRAHATSSAATRSAAAATADTPAQAVTWGQDGQATTLVLYDSTNTWGWLGELYAIGSGNLATHFGKVTAEPVVDYQAGQVAGYTATIYIGSTYDEPIPTAFLNDALSDSKPLMWVGDNIWQLSGTSGSSTDQQFMNAYGWDPATSYFDDTDNLPSVSYKSQTFTRSADNTGGVIAPHITNAAAVTELASVNCTDSSGAATNCASIAQTSGTSFPWAVRSGNLIYVGEVPLSYISQTDRYLVYSDLFFDLLNPTATASHLALVRIEDINPLSSPELLEEYANYLYWHGVPFSVTVIPEYTDPNGVDNNGVPQTVTLAQSPGMIAALDYVSALGGTIIQHGYTHQYSNVANPYDAVSADDFEFYRAQCATTLQPPYTFQAPCPNSDWVIEEGPVPGDSQSWAANRVASGLDLFSQAGLPQPTIWTTPHYAASAADYAGIDQYYNTRYERVLYFGGQLTGGPVNSAHVFGQFFPYEVHDVYGSTIVPENLGDYEPTEYNNNAPNLAANMIAAAQQNLAVTQGTASFFIHSDYDPISVLEATVQGIKQLGYTFVSPQTYIAEN
jgi:uncharacterized protein YdaL